MFSGRSTGIVPENSGRANWSSTGAISTRRKPCAKKASSITPSAASNSCVRRSKIPDFRLQFTAGSFPFSIFLFLLKVVLEVRQRQLQPFVQSHLGLPLENALSLGNVRATPLRIVLRQRLENNRRRIVKLFADALGKLQNGDLLRVPDVYREMLVLYHHPQHFLH